VVRWGYDPDLPDDSPTKGRFDDAFAEVSRLDSRALVAVVFCIRGCGPDRASGERLAHVWLTSVGLLYVAGLVVAHDAVPRFKDLHDDAVLMWHPQLGSHSVNWCLQRDSFRFVRFEGRLEVG
jgi:hypothetical protein